MGKLAAMLGAVALITGGALATMPAEPAHAAELRCDYASSGSGPYADSICWIVWDSATIAAAQSWDGVPVELDLAGGAKLTFRMIIVGKAVAPQKPPLYQAALFGNERPWSPSTGQGIYYGLDQPVGIYQIEVPGGATTVRMDDIQAFDSLNNPVDDYSFLSADAEMTNRFESLVWRSDKDLRLISYRGEAYTGTEACAGEFTGEPGPEVTCAGQDAKSGTGGVVVLEAKAPSIIQVEMIAPQAENKQGTAFGIVLSGVGMNKQVASRYNDSDSFKLTIKDHNGKQVGTGSTGINPSASIPLVQTMGSVASAKYFTFEEEAEGSTDLANYDVSWTCERRNSGYPTTFTPTVLTPTKVQAQVATGDTVTCTATNTAKARAADIAVAKTAKPATGLVEDVPFEYEITARNQSGTALSGVTVTDDVPAGLTIGAMTGSTPTPTSIDGQTITWGNQSFTASGTKTYTFMVTPTRAGTFTNKAVVTAPTGCRTNQTQPDCSAESTVTVNNVDNLTIKKEVTEGATVRPGGWVTYQVTVANTNAKATAKDVTVTDPVPTQLENLTISQPASAGTAQLNGNNLTWTIPKGTASDATISLRGQVKADADFGSVGNTATLSELCGASCTSTATYTVTGNPANLEVAKTGPAAAAVGADVTYQLSVTNAGDAPTKNVNTLTDVLPNQFDPASAIADADSPGSQIDVTSGQVTWTVPAGMPAGATYHATITARLKTTAATGAMTNTAALTQPADCTTRCQATATTVITDSPGKMTLRKSATPATGVHAGDQVTYSFVVENSGAEALHDIVVTDGTALFAGDAITCQGRSDNQIATLAPGTQQTCTMTHRFTAAEVAAGGTGWTTTGLLNTASAAGLDTNNVPVAAPPATATTRFETDTSATVVKKASFTSPVRPGSTVSYTITATYKGDGTLENPVLTDPMFPDATANCAPAWPTSMVKGTDYVCTLTKILTEADIRDNFAAGKIANTATLTGNPSVSPTSPITVKDSEDVPLDTSVPTVDLTGSKSADKAQIDPGDTVTYTVRAKNSGQLTATDVVVSDAFDGAAATPIPAADCAWPGTSGQLAPNEEVTCTFTYQATEKDAARDLTNIAYASAKDGTATIGPKEIGRATVHVSVGTDLWAEKSNDAGLGGRVTPGQTFGYTITVHNDGPAPARGQTLTDKLPDGLVFMPKAQTGWSYDEATGRVTTSTPFDVPAGGKQELSFQVQVDPQATGPKTYVNIGAIDGMATPESCVTKPVVGCFQDKNPLVLDDSKIRWSKSNDVVGSPKLVKVGGTFTYTVTAYNTGTSSATVTAIDVLPEGLAFDGTTQPGWATITERQATSTPIVVPGKDSRSVSIKVKVLPSAPVGVELLNVVAQEDVRPPTDCVADPTLEGCAKDPEPPIVPDHSMVELTKVNSYPDTSVPKVKPGDSFTYTIKATNTSTTKSALQVNVSDTLPDGLEFDGNQASDWRIAGDTATLVKPVDIAPGKYAEWDLKVKVSADAKPGPLRNVAVIDQTDPGTCDPADPANECGVDPNPPVVDLTNVTMTKRNSVQPATNKVRASEKYTYTFVATNGGSQDATDVQIRDLLPTSIELDPDVDQSATWNAINAAGVVTSKPFTLAKSGGSKTLTLAVRVKAATPAGTVIQNTGVVGDDTKPADCVPGAILTGCAIDPDPLIVDDSTIRIEKTNDLTAPRYVQEGDWFTYTLTVRNLGSPTSTQKVTVVDQLPDGLAFNGDTQKGWATLSGKTATSEPITIAGGSQESIHLVVKVIAGPKADDVLTNIAAVQGMATPDQCAADSTRKLAGCAWDDTVTFADHSALQIAKTSSLDTMKPAIVKPGTPFTYTITVTNTSANVAAKQVTVTDTLPDNLQFEPKQNAHWLIKGQTATWDEKIDIGPKGSELFDLLVRVTTPAAGTLRNVATLDDVKPETCTGTPLPWGCAVHDSITVDNTDVTIEKKNSIDGNRVKPGEQFSYTFTLRNEGTEAATGITVTDLLPGGIEIYPADQKPTWGTFDPVTRQFTSGKVDVPAGGTPVTIDLKVRVLPTATALTKIVNAGSIDGTTPVLDCLTTPTAPGCAVDPKPLIVDDSAISLEKTNTISFTPKQVRVGETFNYTIRARNTGTVDAKDVYITDTLPLGLEFSGQQDATMWQQPTGRTIRSIAQQIPGKSHVDLTLTVIVTKDAVVGERLINPSAVDGMATPEECLAAPTKPGCGVDDGPPTVVDHSAVEISKRNDLPSVSGQLPRVVPGQSFTYYLRATNTDQAAPARDVVLTDTLPAGLLFDTPLSDARWHITGTKVISEKFDIPKGGYVELPLEVKVAPSATGELRNAVAIDDKPPSDCTTDVTLPGCDPKPPKVDPIKLSKKGAPARVKPGENVTYTFTVTNPSSAAYDGYRIIDSIPEQASLTAGQDTEWQLVSGTGGPSSIVQTKTPFTVPAGETIYKTLTVTVSGTATADSVIRNVATMAGGRTPIESCVADWAKPDCVEDSTLPVVDASDLMIEKRNDVAAIQRADGTSIKVVRPGDPFSYELTVTNRGGSTALGVVVADKLPAGLSFTAKQDSEWLAATGRTITSRPFDLAKGEDRTLRISVTVDANATGTLTNVGAIPAMASLDQCEADANRTLAGCAWDDEPLRVDNTGLQPAKTPSIGVNEQVKPGQKFGYTLSVDNKGSEPATGVRFAEKLPAGLLFDPTGTNAAAWSYNQATGQVTSVATFTVAPGASQPLVLPVQVDPLASGGLIIKNTASITYDLSPAVNPNTCDADWTKPGCFAEPGQHQVNDSALTITKRNLLTGAPPLVLADDEFGYEIEIANSGRSAADGVVITDQLPDGLAFATLSQAGWARLTASGRATSTAISVPGKGTFTLHLRVVVTKDAKVGATLTNVGAITSMATPEECWAEKNATGTTLPGCAFDAAAPKVTDHSGVTPAKTNSLPGNPPRVKVGQSYTYTIGATNTDQHLARNVKLSDTLPAGLVLNETVTQDGRWQISSDRRTLTWLGDIPAGQSVSLPIHVTVASGAHGTLRNAVVKDGDAPPDCERDPSLPGCDPKPPRVDTVTPTKTSNVADHASVKPGQWIEYTFTAKNTGADAVTGYGFTEQYPAGTLFDQGKNPDWVPVAAPGGPARIIKSAAPFDVPGGTSVTKTLMLQVDPNAKNGTVIYNVGAIIGGDTPPEKCVANPTDPDCFPEPTPHPVDDSKLQLRKTNDVTQSHKLVTVGKSFTYLIEVTNTGTSEAKNETITDRLPVGLVFAATQPDSAWRAPSDARTITSRPLTIAAGESQTLRLAVTVASGASGTLVNVSAVDSMSTVDQCAADPHRAGCGVDIAGVTVDNTALDAVKTASIGASDPVKPGQEYSYTITATNSGSERATNVTVDDRLPAGLTWLVSNDFPTKPAGDVVTSRPFALDTGESLDLTLKVKVDPNATPGTFIDNVGRITKDSDDGPTLPECVKDPTLPQCFDEPGKHLVDDSDLVIVKSHDVAGSPPYVKPGATFSYHLSVTNRGNTPDLDVRVTDLLPKYLSFEPSTQAGWAFSGQLASHEPISVGAGQKVTLTLRVKVASDAPLGTVLKNLSAVDGTTSGGTPVDQCADATKPGCGPDPNPPTVVDHSQVKTGKTNSVDKDKIVRVGQVYSYTITATNGGTYPVTGVVVSDTLPAQLAFEGEQAGWSITGQRAEFTTDLKPGESVTKTLRVKVLPGASGKIYNAVVKDDDPSGPCDVTPRPPECDPEPPTVDNTDVAITKTNSLGAGARVKPGQRFDYTLTAINTGTDPAKDVVFTDTLPAGLEYVASIGKPALDAVNAAGVVTSKPFSLAASGGKQELTITVKVKETGLKAGDTIENTGCVVGARINECIKDPRPPTYDDSAIKLDKANDTGTWHRQVQLGDVFAYTITATNTGQATSDPFTISDTLPPGLEFTALDQAGWASMTKTQATSDPITLKGTASVKLRLEVKVVPPAKAGDVLKNASAVDGKNDPATCLTDPKLPGCGVDPEPPTVVDDGSIQVSKANNVPVTRLPDGSQGRFVKPGQSFEYTLTVHNQSRTSYVRNVGVKDLLPNGLEFVTIPSGWTQAGQTITTTIDELGPSKTLTYQFTVKVQADVSGTLINVVAVGDKVPDCDTNPQLPGCDPNPPIASSIKLVKKNSLPAGRTTVSPGEVFSYTITAVNSGKGTASGVRVTDRLPAGLQFYGHQTSDWLAPVGSTITSGAFSLAGGASRELVLTVRVATDAAHGMTIRNAGKVFDPTDPNPDDPDPCLDNPSLPECGVDPNPPIVDTKVLQIAKSNDLPGAAPIVRRGQPFGYDITVRNVGHVQVTGVTVTDRLPAGIEWASLTQDGWSATSSSTADSLSAPFDLGPGQAKTLHVNVIGVKGAGDLLRNVAAISALRVAGQPLQGTGGGTGTTSVSGPTGQAVTIDQCVNDPTQPGCAYDDVAGTGGRDGVTIVKSNDVASGVVKPGQTYRYTITVTNGSKAPSKGITVSDSLPAGLSFDPASQPHWTMTGSSATSAPFDLGAGQSRSFTLSVKVAPDAKGQLQNVAVMDERSPEDCVVNPALPGCAPDPKPPIVDPGSSLLTVKKDAATTDVNRNGVMDAGDEVRYRFVVTNTGTAATKQPTEIIDPMLQAAGIAVVCPTAELQPGQSLTCLASAPYYLTVQDQAAGRVRNIAVATSGAEQSRPVSYVVTTSGTCDGSCPTTLPTVGSGPTTYPVPAPTTNPGPLPHTGAQIAALLSAALLLLGAGSAAILLGRKRRRRIGS